MSLANGFGRSIPVVGLIALMITGCQSLESLTSKSEGISEKRKQRSLAAAQRFDQERDRAELQAAQNRRREGDLEGCTATLERLLARNPDHFEARVLMAETLLEADRPQEALPYLEPLAAEGSDDSRVHHLIGMLLDAEGQRADALVFYERAARLQPRNEVYRVSYETLAASEAPTEPRVEIAQAPTAPAPVPLPVEPEPSSAESFRAATEEPNLSPTHPAPPAEFREKPDPLTASFPDAAPNRPTPLSVSRAEEREAGLQPSGAGDNRAQGRSTVSDFPSPEPGECFVSDQGPMEGAEGAGSIGEDGPADDRGAMSATRLLEKGRSALSQGMVGPGLAYFQEAMSLRPDDPQIPADAAVCALRHNQPALVVSLLEPLLEVFPDSAAIRRILATAYYRLGNYQSSQVVLGQALSLDNSSALSYFLMGCTLVKLGQPAAAETCFRQARSLDPRYPPNR